MSNPTKYSLGKPVFDHAAGRFRINVYQSNAADGFRLVGAGYGDTRKEAAANANNVMDTRKKAEGLRA